jgi:hypothetical protein
MTNCVQCGRGMAHQNHWGLFAHRFVECTTEETGEAKMIDERIKLANGTFAMPWDFEKAKAGASVVDGQGEPVEWHWFKSVQLGIVTWPRGDFLVTNKDGNAQLYLAIPETVRWVNVYPSKQTGVSFESKSEADERGDAENHIGQIKFTFLGDKLVAVELVP